MIKMHLTRHVPYIAAVQHFTDGSRSQLVHTQWGIVKVFASPADGRDRAFTLFAMYLYPYEFRASLPKNYHERWFRRLARYFAYQCSKKLETA